MTSAISIMWVKAIMTILLSQPCISTEEKRERKLGTLLRAAHDDEAPGLYVVSARRAEAGFEDPAQVFNGDGRAVEAGRRAPFAYRLAQGFFRLRRLGHFRCVLFCCRSEG